MRRFIRKNFILFAVVAIILGAGLAWGQPKEGSTAGDRDYKVFKIKGGQLDKKNFTEESANSPRIAELEKAAGGKPGSDDIIFVHMPNPGTCVYYRGSWY